MNGPPDSATARETRREVGRVGRFIVIGLGSVAVDLLVCNWLSTLMPETAAKGLSFLAGMVPGFIGNKFWAFQSARKSASEPLVYIGLYAVTLCVNVGVFAAVQAAQQALLGTSARLFPWFVATGTTTVLNYLGLRLIAFRKGIEERDQAEEKPEQLRRAA